MRTFLLQVNYKKYIYSIIRSRLGRLKKGVGTSMELV